MCFVRVCVCTHAFYWICDAFGQVYRVQVKRKPQKYVFNHSIKMYAINLCPHCRSRLIHVILRLSFLTPCWLSSHTLLTGDRESEDKDIQHSRTQHSLLGLYTMTCFDQLICMWTAQLFLFLICHYNVQAMNGVICSIAHSRSLVCLHTHLFVHSLDCSRTYFSLTWLITRSLATCSLDL